METGIIKHTKEKDLPLADICPVDLRSTERRLRNTDLLLTYKVIAVGYALAAVIFLIEIATHLIKRLLKRKKGKLDADEQTMNFGHHLNNRGDLILDKQAQFMNQTPPLIHQNKGDFKQKRTQYINGRNYYIVISNDGDQRLIPIRAPSAFLFQYAA